MPDSIIHGLPRPPDEDVLVDEAELWLVEVGACVEAGVGADHGQAGAARARVLRQAHLNQGGKCLPEFINFLLTMNTYTLQNIQRIA